jgi:hypothetical protein
MPPAQAHVLSSPGSWKYGTVGIRVPFSRLMISCMSHWKPSARVPQASASATEKVEGHVEWVEDELGDVELECLFEEDLR